MICLLRKFLFGRSLYHKIFLLGQDLFRQSFAPNLEQLIRYLHSQEQFPKQRFDFIHAIANRIYLSPVCFDRLAPHHTIYQATLLVW